MSRSQAVQRHRLHLGARRRAAGRLRPPGPLGLLRRLPGRAQRQHGRAPSRDHRLHRPVRLRQDHRPALPQPDERPRALGPGRRARSCTTGSTSTTPRWTRSRSGAGSAWSSRSPTRSPSRSTTTSPTGPHRRGQRRATWTTSSRSPPPGRALGRGQGPSRRQRHGPLGRPAAAAVHRPGPGRRARGDPHGRALLGPRPDRHRPASRT